MIEEKEKKLTELLERQGISKKDYFFLAICIFIYSHYTYNNLYIILFNNISNTYTAIFIKYDFIFI